MTLPVEITEINEGREYSDDEKGERTGTRVFRLRYDIATPGPGQAIINQLVKRYDIYQEPGGFIDETCLATKGNAAPEDPGGSFNHLVTISYSTKWWDEVARGLLVADTGATGPRPHGGGGSEPEANSPANPIARPWQLSWGTVTMRELLERDRDIDNTADKRGFLIRTTAGVPYDPPLETERRLLTLTVKRNTTSYVAQTAQLYFNTTNRNDFTVGRPGAFLAGAVFAPGTVKCEYWIADTEFENGIPFYAETIFFVINEGRVIPSGPHKGELSGWRRVLLNAGLQELKDGKIKDILTKQGHPISKPWPLDVVGEKLEDGYAESDLLYRDFVEFSPADFEVFRLS